MRTRRSFFHSIGVAVTALLCLAAGCRPSGSGNPKVPGVFAPHQGVYKGFSPTDASPTGMGEFELTIVGGKADIRFATGNTVVSDSAVVGDFVQMTKAQLKEEFQGATDADVDGMVVGYRPKSGNRPVFLFFKTLKSDTEYETLVVLTGGASEQMGPTILFTPSAVKAGKYDEGIRKLEERMGAGSIPRIANGGRPTAKPATPSTMP